MSFVVCYFVLLMLVVVVNVVFVDDVHVLSLIVLLL